MIKKLFNNKISIIISILLSLFFVIGYSFDKDFSFNTIVKSPFKCLIAFLIIGVVVYFAISYFYDGKKLKIKNFLTKIENGIKESKLYKRIDDCDKKHNSSFYILAICMFLVYFIFFLRFYPAVITSDTSEQIGIVLGDFPARNHHPIFHTACIGIALNLGKLIFNSYNAGLAIYAIFQMIAMSLIFSYVLKYLKRIDMPILFRIICLLFFTFCPINIVFSFTIWKDIPFSLCVLLFVVYLHRFLFVDKEYLSSKANIVLFTVTALLLMLFRNNGVYLIIFTLIASFFVKIEHKRAFIGSLSGALVLYLLFMNLLLPYLNIPKSSPKEMYSIPLQQFARIVKYKGDELTPTQKEKINQYCDYSLIANKYLPYLSDHVKATFKLEGYEKDKIGLFKLYFELAFKYPKETVEAFLSNTYGYWYPFSHHDENVSRSFDVRDEINQYDFEQIPLIKSNILLKYTSLAAKDYPLLDFVFSRATVFYVFLICLFYTIYKKDINKIIIYIPLIALLLTCISGPLNGSLRYFYSFYICIPIYLAINMKVNNQ